MKIPEDIEQKLHEAFGGTGSADDAPATPPQDDSGVVALALLLSIHQTSVDAVQLRHELGHSNPLTSADIVRLARRQTGVRAKSVAVAPGRLSGQPLPALASGPDGWFIIGRLVEDGVLVQRPGRPVEKVGRADLDAMWDGSLVLITTRESRGATGKRFDLTWFIPQMVRYRRLIGEVLLITFTLNLLGLAAPLLFQNVIDKVLAHNALSTLNVLAFGFVAISLWETMFGWIRSRLYSETSQKIDVELGARLFRHLLALPLSYFEKRRVGDTVTRVRQLETVREFLTTASLTVLVDPLFTIVFMIAMVIYSPPLFAIVAVSLVGYVAVSLFVTRPLRARIEEKFERGAASNALLVESVTGIQTVKASAVEPQWQDRWERQLAAYSASALRVTNLGTTGSQAVELISKLSFAAILFFGAKSVIAGTLTVGGLVAFNMFAQRVSGPVIRMAQLWQDFQQVRISVERLGDILNHPAEPQSPSKLDMPAMKGAVTFEKVRFRYAPDQPPAVEEVSLSIAPGQSIGIVGSSGSGKSTLTKLLQKLYIAESGRVLVDGIDVAQLDPTWLRRQIGVVLQENILFNRSIRENIALVSPAMPFERVMKAARLAGAHEFILQQPQGYDTPIVERGVNLSGGQRQRIAIARALVTDPRILILDEATSALDAESEEIIRRNLKAISKGRTVLVIAHRLSAVRDCDRIIAIEKGRIVESGSHNELIALGGRYAELHRRQSGVQGIAA
ncbi:type I secretion system permease/ATPase [Sphingomonas aliaeris]|uniref:Type I secretion system permease/ATPase n=1 Tax=Sphingomonas aliaeris TaxID=2759526 RepID=A0A974NWB8_9SPHN|nr:type I secretion system permease/ATPase [Sphingomonas aliaeris]QQV78077.1 type I secretion system permease/ATPase [Sphingomonas aliaeris]